LKWGVPSNSIAAWKSVSILIATPGPPDGNSHRSGNPRHSQRRQPDRIALPLQSRNYKRSEPWSLSGLPKA
jgi:hypothetical protein